MSDYTIDAAAALSKHASQSPFMTTSQVTGSPSGRVAGFALTVNRRKYWVSVERLSDTERSCSEHKPGRS